jgi:hypothetical protein
MDSARNARPDQAGDIGLRRCPESTWPTRGSKE